jgi:hypothetical protein
MKSDAETLAKALSFALQRLKEDPPLGKWKAAEEAAMRFNLGPLDAEWLLNQLAERKNES